MTSQELANRLEKIITDKKGIDVKLYDCRGKSNLTDFFIIATATSVPHIRALASEIRASLKNTTTPIFSGTPESGWIVIDCYDVIVHIFRSELRSYYAIDDFLNKLAF